VAVEPRPYGKLGISKMRLQSSSSFKLSTFAPHLSLFLHPRHIKPGSTVKNVQ